MIPPFPGGKIMPQTEKPYHKVELTPEQEAWLRKYFPTNRGDILRRMCGLNLSTFYRILRDLGIKKEQRVRARIWRAASAKGKKKMQENGYYDSLKGHAPSRQCYEACRKRWQEVREGKRLHPLRQMKKDHPRLYAARNRRIGEQRRKLIKMEHFRMMSGEKRQTKLRISLVHYTKSQVSHRLNAQRRGYFVMEDCSDQSGERWNIYYDQNTHRAPRFEANLQKDGFHVLDGTGL